jgi:hypothetical protein
LSIYFLLSANADYDNGITLQYHALSSLQRYS